MLSQLVENLTRNANKTMPEATPTFKDAVLPCMGIDTVWVHRFKTSAEMP